MKYVEKREVIVGTSIAAGGVNISKEAWEDYSLLKKNTSSILHRDCGSTFYSGFKCFFYRQRYSGNNLINKHLLTNASLGCMIFSDWID
jgi:hypothetical protein